jgi:hypothetical protein
MTLMLLQIGGAIVGAAIGAGVGYSQIMCPDGGCAITGTWFGGAAMGGAMGFAAIGVLPIFGKPKLPDDESPNELDTK